METFLESKEYWKLINHVAAPIIAIPTELKKNDEIKLKDPKAKNCSTLLRIRRDAMDKKFERNARLNIKLFAENLKFLG